MIRLDDESPRWLRELARFLPLKNLLFVEGNILDLVSYPVKRPDGQTYWTEADLPTFFKRLLTELRYEILGFFDPVDGLSFPSKEMEALYNQIRSGRAPQEKGAQAGFSGVTPKTEPTSARFGASNSGDFKTPTPLKSYMESPRSASQDQQRHRVRQVDPNAFFDGARVALANEDVPCAFVLNFASRLVSSPNLQTREDRNFFTKILKASLESKAVLKDKSRWNNVIILICDKLNDLPPFLYINNPRSRTIHIEKPDTLARSRFIHRTYGSFHRENSQEMTPSPEFVSTFAALTEGLACYELKSLVDLSLKEKIPVERFQEICKAYKYGITKSEWDDIKTRLGQAEQILRRRIKGQEMAIARVMDIVKRAGGGLAAGSSTKSNRPRGVLFFAGPTGVGKTEMAKALAEVIFGDEDRCIRFDMSEYSAPQSDEKLLGAPPGYIGYQEGGQLTNALKEKPFSILLFDEIEKAHGGIFDKFLQILDDGRLTDGKGETVYFSESIIIFTSNLGTVKRWDEQGEKPSLVSPDTHTHQQMRNEILKAIREHFNFVLGRPEILNRFGDNFVVFDFIRPPKDEEILDLLISRLEEAAKATHKIHLRVEPCVRARLSQLVKENLQYGGGRGIRNTVDSALVNPLNRALFEQADLAGRNVRLKNLRDNGPEAPYQYELDFAIEPAVAVQVHPSEKKGESP